ncbi:tRNA lysidine(34) synthetase TilS [Clostridium sp. AL.422]|uniref:tRNA lysidine(34) synthetase TilS n=1 Tax=Clostridium TaxID=1485 RepID=UPI00293DC7D9|nr:MULTISPECIES: tRNA lysidine(34) synthetase TilS [unclassified Clostridium]MDV4150262.1 tRNA lysidine(34) synthetase TilS [Clostridium sp. AL.422]
MINKVKAFIIENNLIQIGDRILVALSGGPDSVCLLNVLYELREDFNIEIAAAHVNHMLRGEEAFKDEEYARNICKNLNVKFFSTRIDINEVSKQKGISHELAGREERYKFFQLIIKENGYNKIAVAHNANDQAETVIMNMMRGTAIEGLCGIRSKREGGIIRPILCLSRGEIEHYCKINNLAPRIDKSNFENIYSRNKVRLDILPYMKNNFNEDIIETINRMANLLQIDNDFIEKECNNYYKKYCTNNGNKLIISKSAFSIERAILTRLIKRAFIEFTGKYTNFEMKHIYEVISLANNSTNKKINLPYGVIAENIYGDIYFKIRENKNKELKEVILNINELDSNSIEFGNYSINFAIISNKKNIEFSNNVLIKFFDYDKIKERLIIRKRINGDKMIPLGMKGTKKVKDIFIDLKIPIEKRDEIPVLCFDNEIAWLVGYKVSESFKITKETKSIIKITFARKE